MALLPAIPLCHWHMWIGWLLAIYHSLFCHQCMHMCYLNFVRNNNFGWIYCCFQFCILKNCQYLYQISIRANLWSVKLISWSCVIVSVRAKFHDLNVMWGYTVHHFIPTICTTGLAILFSFNYSVYCVELITWLLCMVCHHETWLALTEREARVSSVVWKVINKYRCVTGSCKCIHALL